MIPNWRGEESVFGEAQNLIDNGYSKKEATAIAIKIAGRKQRDKKKKKKIKRTKDV